MQTTLIKRNVFQVQDHLQNKSESMNHFAQIYGEWKTLQNYNQTEKLKTFEKKHGTAFVQLLALFEKLVEI